MLRLTGLPAEPRTLGGKCERRRLRAAGKVPAIMYGRQIGNVPIALEGREVEQYIKRHGGGGGMVEVQMGADSGAALIKEIQRHPVTGRVLHMDLMRVSMQDRITAGVPVLLAGESEDVVNNGGVITQQLTELSVSCRADQLPDQISVDISGLQIGHAIHVSELELPEGVEPTHSPDTIVVSATVSAAARELEAIEAAAEAAAEAAEPEAAAEGAPEETPAEES